MIRDSFVMLTEADVPQAALKFHDTHILSTSSMTPFTDDSGRVANTLHKRREQLAPNCRGSVM